jgi:hypothetical protein
MDLHLHPKQSVAFESEATEILYGGAAGGGKSHLLRVAAIAYCCAVPGIQVYLFRRRYPDLMSNHFDGPTGFPAILAEWVRAKWARINYSENNIHIGTDGSAIHLRHVHHEKDLAGYQGADMHVLLIDEATHFTEKMYRFLRHRCRLPEGSLEIPDGQRNRFPRIILGSNPGGIGHGWVKEMFIKGCQPLEIRQMSDAGGDGGMRRQFIPALLEDNPSLDTKEYEGKLYGLGAPEMVKAMRHGDWDIVVGGMFNDLWDRSVHIIPPFKIPSGWRVDRSFDWGSSKPFSIGWWAESNGESVALPDGTERNYPAGTLFRISEWYGWNGKRNEGCRMISTEIARGALDREKALRGTLLNGHRVAPGPADSSIYDVIDGRSIADEMSGVGVRWIKANKGPGSRRNGWELLRRRLKASLRVKEGQPLEEPGIFIFDTCQHFIDTVPELPRLERDPEDVDTNAEDHIADETRYRLLVPKKEITSTHLRLA